MTAYCDHLIDHPSAWTGADMAQDDRWMVHLTPADIDEVDAAVQATAGQQVTDITSADYALPKVSARLAKLGQEIDQGRGFAVIKNLPVARYSEAEAARALWCLGLKVGQPFPQDAARKLLHDVRDTGDKPETNPNLRIYQTNYEQQFHTDGGDLLMLLCRRQAKTGGRSRVASAANLFNWVWRQDPELAQILQEPFYFDTRGQQLPGQPRVQCLPVLTWHHQRLNILQKRLYIEYAQRFDEVPRLTEKQIAALDLLDAAAEEPANHFAFDMVPGDIQLASNFSVLHARDRYIDHPEADLKRHMLRLWIALKQGRPLPEVYRYTREHGPLFEMRATA
jgi:hypothetical protein